MAALGCVVLVCALVLSASVTVGRCETIYVDQINGQDVAECLTNTSLPCKTLNFAYYRRNVSVDDELYDMLTQPSEDASSDVDYVLFPGVYRNKPPLLIINSTNVSFSAKESNKTVFIQCGSFPNYGTEGYGPSGNYSFDDLNVLNSVNVTFNGLVFEKCGNFNSAVHVMNVDGLNIRDCVFTESTGTALQIRLSTNVVIESTWFTENIDARLRHTANPIGAEINVESVLSEVFLGGAVTFFAHLQTDVYLTIRDCHFVLNHGSRGLDSDTPVLLRANGHGGAMLIQISNVSMSRIVIEDSTFSSNSAEVDGGGVYMSLSNESHDNKIVLQRLTFLNNSASVAGGGAISFNSFQISFNNSIEILNSAFESNNASAGGAVSFVLYQSDPEKTPDNLIFKNCTFVRNKAENDGTAVGLFSLLHVDEFGFPVLFEDCVFEDNLSLDQNEDTSALAAFRFPITLNGSNIFRNNSGGGITLLNTQMDTYGEIIMDSNTAAFGGGLAMDDRCLLRLHPGIVLNFTNNTVSESGAGIYVDFPPIRFVIEFFNRLCFVQYSDSGSEDVPPQDWDASINFVNNSARLSGAAIYASDLHGCSWLGNVSGDFNIIFNDSYANTPFYYSNNIVVETDVTEPRLATSPLSIFAVPKPKVTEVQPGELVTIELSAQDQLLNYREAVWSLSRPGQETILGALPASTDSFLYEVPPLSVLRQGLGVNVSNTSNFSITLTFSLLRTLAQSIPVTLIVNPSCHPGYKLDEGRETCMIRDRSEILRDSSNNRNVYIREGAYAWAFNNGQDIAIHISLPSYLNCTPEGRLSGCLYEFDSESNQCVGNREGIMCGRCKQGYSITLDLQSCQENEDCWQGLLVFLIICVAVVIASFLIMFFNVQVPNQLKGFLFYAQVIGLVFRQFDSIRQVNSNDKDGEAIEFARTVANLLGFSLPIPLCISDMMEAHWVVLLSYVSPILALITIVIYAVAARRLSCLGNRTSLGGIALLLLFIYKYVADASFVLISCVATSDGYRFFYNGSKFCSEADFLPFHIISWLLLIAVFIAPFFLAVLPYKFYGKFKQFSDVLTNGLRNKYRWWGGWDLGRRLVFVIVTFFGLVTRPSLVLFLLAITALVILTIHCFTKPYKERYINIIEALILLDLLLVVGLFIDPDNQVPVGFSIFMLLLPYLYLILFLLWRLGRFLYTKVTKKPAPHFWDLMSLIYLKVKVALKVTKNKSGSEEDMNYHDYGGSLDVNQRVSRVEGQSSDLGEGNTTANTGDEFFDQLRVPNYDDD